MIQTFADTGTVDIYKGLDSRAARRALPKDLWATARRKLDWIDSARSVDVLRVPPGNRLEALKGSRAGRWSIRINDQYRITFRSRKDTRMRFAAKTTIKAPSLDELREPPTHPGEMLLEEFLKPKGVTQVEAARYLSMSTTRLNEIIRGKRGISADTAWRLGDWLGTGPEVWMDLQSKWDLWHARKVRKSA